MSVSLTEWSPPEPDEFRRHRFMGRKESMPSRDVYTLEHALMFSILIRFHGRDAITNLALDVQPNGVYYQFARGNLLTEEEEKRIRDTMQRFNVEGFRVNDAEDWNYRYTFKEIAQRVVACYNLNGMTTDASGSVFEWIKDWDIFQPNKVVRTEDDVPSGSRLHTNAVFRNIFQITKYLQPSWTYTIGIPLADRRKRWQSDDDLRRRMASFLLDRHPELLVDMAHEPMRPWKGMYFFHGTKYDELQSGSSTECNLKFAKANYTAYSAFTSPYFTKAMNYAKSKYIYIYQLDADGMELKMLDLREDYQRLNEGLWEPIHQMAGIKDSGRDRTPKMWDLYEFFHDSGIHGAIVNMDIEWVWWDPSKLLRYVTPTTEFEKALFYGATDWSMLQVWKDQITPERIHAFLRSDKVYLRMVDEQDLPHLRWYLDKEAGYVTQFLLTHPVRPAVWNARQSNHEQDVLLCECRYEDLWQALAPDALHLYMGATLKEGSHDRVLPYQLLVDRVELLNLTRYLPKGDNPHCVDLRFAVHLPNGHIMIVPPLHHHTSELTEVAKPFESLLRLRNKRSAPDDETRNVEPRTGARLLLM